MNDFLHTLKQPEYVHVLLNPLPVYATAMGVIALVVAWLMRNRGAQIVALLLIVVGCGSVWPVVEYGERAEDRVTAMSNKDAKAWLDVHAARADKLAPVFYVTALIAALTIILPGKYPKVNHVLLAVTLVAALASLACGGWISQAGGKVRHSEFREGPPPVSETSSINTED